MIKQFFLFLIIFTSFSIQAQNKVDDLNRKQGVWIKYHENGKLRYKGVFKDNLEIDTFNFYDNKGRILSTRIYTKPGKESLTKMYNFMGVLTAEGKLIGKKKEGDWVYFQGRQLDTLKIEKYENNLLEGKQYTYFKNKNLASVIPFNKGKRNGNYIEYYNNKQIQSKGLYVNDELDGTIIRYFRNGKIKRKEYFNKGTKINIWEEFYPDGRLKQRIKHSSNK